MFTRVLRFVRLPLVLLLIWAALRFAIVLVRVIRMMAAHGVIPPGSGFDVDNFATAELRRLIGPELGVAPDEVARLRERGAVA